MSTTSLLADPAAIALVQLADAETIALIDPMPGAGLEPLVELLLAPGRVKVLHAARQGIEVLLPLTGAPLTPVLDTQVAAALLGFPPQIGYADLIQRVLG